VEDEDTWQNRKIFSLGTDLGARRKKRGCCMMTHSTEGKVGRTFWGTRVGASKKEGVISKGLRSAGEGAGTVRLCVGGQREVKGEKIGGSSGATSAEYKRLWRGRTLPKVGMTYMSGRLGRKRQDSPQEGLPK